MSRVVVLEKNIAVPVFYRLFFGWFCSFLTFFSTLLVIVLLFPTTLPILALVVSILVGGLGFTFWLASNNILRRMTKWISFKRFLFLQSIPYLLTSLMLTIVILYLVSGYIFPSLSSWFFWILWAEIVVLMYVQAFSNMFTVDGYASLLLKQFISDYQKQPAQANYVYLLRASKQISNLLRSYNVSISPYSLALGMSLRQLKGENNLNVVVNGLEDFPKNFNILHGQIDSFLSLAREKGERGIKEPSYLTFEKVMDWLKYVAVPIIVVSLPELIKLLRTVFHL